MKKLLILALLALSTAVYAEETKKEEVKPQNPVLGFWQTIDDETKLPKSIVSVYEYQGVIYARILKTYEAEGESKGIKERDNIYTQKYKADKIKGEPFFCGLDFVWGMTTEPGETKYKGRILNPPTGKIYKSEMWLEDGNLIVRGKIGPFGKNQTWKPFKDASAIFEDKTLSIPDIKTFTPVVPEVK